MGFDRSDETSDSDTEDFIFKTATNIGGKTRVKTALRLKYEAECEVIRKKLGSIDEVRRDLGLSQRKMAQLLMVDPSAWTRWVKNEDTIPPHVYRSLQWYLALIDKQPEWHPQNAFLGAFRGSSTNVDSKKITSEVNQMVQNQKAELEDFRGDMNTVRAQSHTIMQNIEKLGQVQFSWKLLVLINTVFLAYLFLFRA